jgi:uncharacterized membrane protein
MSGKLSACVQVLSMAGILLALYLLWEQWSGAPSLCSINATINCDAIIKGAVARTFGIPTPLYGLVGYMVIFAAAVFKKTPLLLGMATFGLAFCLWIGYRELFELHVVCPVCILCQCIMLLVFALAILAFKKRHSHV